MDPFTIACQQGDMATLENILNTATACETIKKPDRSGRTCLHYCAEYARLECADYLITFLGDRESGSVQAFLDHQDNEGFTALIIAVINGHRAMVRSLTAKGANVNLHDKERHTAVHWATVCMQLECLDELLNGSAEASLADIHGAYPLHYAAQMSAAGKSTAADPAPSSEPNNTTNGSASAAPGLAFLRRLIGAGVAVDALDQDKRTPLLWAASSGNSEACRVLFMAGSNPNQGDKDGLRALHCAASRGHVDCLTVLLQDCNAEVDARDRHECTALMYAATLGYIDCIVCLAKAGADPNHRDRKGRSAAHLAASKGQTESIIKLEDLGADIWLRNHRGDLPLHEAAQAGYVGVMDFLLSRKPTAINTCNRDGRSCLHIAAMTKDMALCRFLVENRINVNLIMHNSKMQYFTALDLAIAKANPEMAKYLRLNGATDAQRITRNSAARIQRSFLKRKDDGSRGVSSETTPIPDPNGILEEAFETGIRSMSQDSTPSRQASLQVRDDPEETEYSSLETDPTGQPILPREIATSPTIIGSLTAQERRSTYDDIMNASVLEGLSETLRDDSKRGSLTSSGQERSSGSSEKRGSVTLSGQERITVTEKRGSVTSFTGGKRGSVTSGITMKPGVISSKLSSPHVPLRQTSTPVFEMSTLTLHNDDTRKTQSARSPLVKYETDSDDDFKHPSLRTKHAVSREDSPSPTLSVTEIIAGRGFTDELKLIDTDQSFPPRPPTIHTQTSQVFQLPAKSTSEFGAQTDPPLEDDLVPSRGSTPLSSASSPQVRPDTSELAVQAVLNTEGNSVGIQTKSKEMTSTGITTNTPRQMQDSAVSARSVYAQDFQAQTGESARTGRRQMVDRAASALSIKLSSRYEPVAESLMEERHRIETKDTGVSARVPPEVLNIGSLPERKLSDQSSETSPQKRPRLRWDQTESFEADEPVVGNNTYSEEIPRRSSKTSAPKAKISHVSFKNSVSERGTSRQASLGDISADERGTEDNDISSVIVERDLREEEPSELYTRFRPPTPRVRPLKEIEKTVPPIRTTQRKTGAVAKIDSLPAKVNVNGFARRNKEPAKSSPEPVNGERKVVKQKMPIKPKLPVVTVPVVSPDPNMPNISNKFLASFQNTLYELGPQSVVMKYLDNLTMMRKKDTKYNEPVVLAKIIPKYVKDMQNFGGPDLSKQGNDSEVSAGELLRDVKTFDDWQEYLLGQWKISRSLTNSGKTNATFVVSPNDAASNTVTISRNGSSVSNRSPGSVSLSLPDKNQSSTTTHSAAGRGGWLLSR
ncbi:protein phosphatase 1 regulatory subunit 12A-like isoform X2 [Paramacrobiotus metropolitanus]|uniref:protein phosphatase 1 regulatory subunit 12A-like isoform X2 n=1 Tax=Paramacrobiotus metropolitanus TaxID=2943436 RepID=UPI002445E31A|nr:protein phosphatase 1 regulatory subunit 12A-like isoform X2 [Paramacrobiotus metropolitanus]